MSGTTSLAPAGRAYDGARLRWATLDDAAMLHRLFGEARPEEPETVEEMRSWLEHGGALLLEDQTGTPLCALRWREADEGWQVDRVATREDARGNGFGRWLMTKVEALAIRYNVPALTLRLPRGELLPYYERMGYSVRSSESDGLVLGKRVGGVWQMRSQPRQ